MERSLTYIALMAALVAILGIVPNFTLAFGVPISAQSLGILLCGTILGAKRGFLAVLLFLLLALAGLPILTGMRGGIGAFTGPSFGFLIGYPFAAFAAGFVVERLPLKITYSATIGAALGGIIVLYAFGIPAMAWKLDKSLSDTFVLCLSFLPADLIKVAIVGALSGSLARIRPALFVPAR